MLVSGIVIAHFHVVTLPPSYWLLIMLAASAFAILVKNELHKSLLILTAFLIAGALLTSLQEEQNRQPATTHSYSHLYGLPCTGLRFFTVYGPWGRPDMALQLFAHAIMKDEPIKVFNGGRMRRDFTYIDDIVEGVVRLLPLAPKPDPQWDAATPDPATSSAPWRIYNIGNNQTVELNDFIAALDEALGKKAIRDLLPMQPGDVEATWANIDALSQATGFAPVTPLKTGIERFVAWFKEYYYA